MTIVLRLDSRHANHGIVVGNEGKTSRVSDWKNDGREKDELKESVRGVIVISNSLVVDYFQILG